MAPKRSGAKGGKRGDRTERGSGKLVEGREKVFPTLPRGKVVNYQLGSPPVGEGGEQRKTDKVGVRTERYPTSSPGTRMCRQNTTAYRCVCIREQILHFEILNLLFMLKNTVKINDEQKT